MDSATEKRSWLARHPRRVDATIAAVLWLLLASFTLVMSVDSPGDRQGEYIGIAICSTVMTLALAARRSHPEVMLLLVTGAHVLQLFVTDTVWPANVSAPIAAYAAAAYASTRVWRWAALAISAVSGPLGVIDWESQPPTLAGTIISAVMLSAAPMLAWLWGDLARKRRELVARLREQNLALRRDRDQRAQIAAHDERTRIAREMHDVVAHSLAVVVVQADGAAYTAANSPDWQRQQATDTLETIASTARGALADTRRLVGVLRASHGGEDAGFTPTESLADLPRVVQRVRDSGVDVRLDAPEDLTDLPRETALAALRVVQEGLTNVIKHAGPGARATVRVTRDDDGTTVLVEDDGRGAAAPDDGDGHGLVGLRERAAAVGGTLHAGSRAGGGFRLVAHLPEQRGDG